MSSNHSGRTSPYSDVDHPHRITYSPFREEEDPQPVPMIPPRPPTSGPIALENRGTQTSPKPCPIHQQYVTIETIPPPPFARQTKPPPTLQEALELRELLRNPNLQTPIITHCELHSLMFTLHRTYRNLIADEDQYPNEKQRKTLEANIIEALYQITRTLWSTQDSHQTRVTITTTPPRPNPLPERIQNKETSIPPYLPNHLIVFKQWNQKEQKKRQKEELLHPRTKKGRKRSRSSL